MKRWNIFSHYKSMEKQNPKDLGNLCVLLSASLPDALKRTNRSQDFFDLMVTLVGSILSSSGKLVYGGSPVITPLVHRVAKLVAVNSNQIKLFQLGRFRTIAPREIYDKSVFNTVTWVEPIEGKTSLADEMREMRQQMVQISQVAIFIGGKTGATEKLLPGVREEYLQFVEKGPGNFAYLVGLLEGETRNIINEIDKVGKRESNFLSDDQSQILHHSKNIDLISSLVLADLRKVRRYLNGLSRRQILVVDDRSNWLATIRTILGSRYDLSLQKTASDAKIAFMKNEFDLLILDKNIPEESGGVRLLKHFRTLRPKLPAIMLTEYPSAESATKIMRLGATDYISKSTDNLKVVLTSKIDNLLSLER